VLLADSHTYHPQTYSNLNIISISSLLFSVSSCGLSTCIYMNVNEWISGIDRAVPEYSIMNSTEYSSRKMLDLHSSNYNRRMSERELSYRPVGHIQCTRLMRSRVLTDDAVAQLYDNPPAHRMIAFQLIASCRSHAVQMPDFYAQLSSSYRLIERRDLMATTTFWAERHSGKDGASLSYLWCVY